MDSLIVLRHAEAEHLVSAVRGGTNDTALTPRGLLQAHRTAVALARLVGNRSVRVWCAPSQRARHTACIVARALRTQPQTDPDLATLAGEPQPDEEEVPLAAFLADHPRIDWEPCRNAETWRSLHRRAKRFLSTRDSSSDVHVVVTHGVTHIALVQAWLGFSEAMLEAAFFTHEVSPCGVTRLGRDTQGFPFVAALSDVAHLVPGVRIRLQALVLRDGKALFAYGNVGNNTYRHSFIGGKWEEGETAEEGVLRELREEAQVEGRIIWPVPDATRPDHLTYLVDIGDQSPDLGENPEETGVPWADRHLQGLVWLDLADAAQFSAIDRGHFLSLVAECHARGHRPDWLATLERLLAEG